MCDNYSTTDGGGELNYDMRMHFLHVVKYEVHVDCLMPEMNFVISSETSNK